MGAKTPIIETMPLSQARASLKQTLDAQQRAKAIADQAQQVVDAAAAALENAREEAARFDAEDADSVKNRLAALKGQPAKSQEQIREHLRARILAKEEVAVSSETLTAARLELAEAADNVARVQKVSASAVTSVLSESVTDVIAKWEKVNAERERLRTVLRALILAEIALDTMPAQQQANVLSDAAAKANLPYGDAVDWRNLQNRVGAALNRSFGQQDPGPSLAKARAFWARYSDSLLVDPSADLPALPSAAELF
jgi:chromosome segregation ATPase